jgi:cytochrome P450
LNRGSAAITRGLLAAALARGEMDFATEFSVPLAMTVIAELIGIPAADWEKFRHWSDVILTLSYTRSGGSDAAQAAADFRLVTQEMSEDLARMIADRRATPTDDLLTRLVEAELDGERLEPRGDSWFFPTARRGRPGNDGKSAQQCDPLSYGASGGIDAAARQAGVLPSAIEEVLRYRSPVQWMMRAPRRDVEMSGQVHSCGDAGAAE